MNILVVGGAGYIGSHVCKAVHEAGMTPVVFDNFQNGHPWAVRWGPHVKGDLLDLVALENVFNQFPMKGVIHLASLIDVRESGRDPGKYYQINVVGTLNLLNAMVKHQIGLCVFSSSAAVYGIPSEVPIQENHPCNPINVYGKTKWIVETILADFFAAHRLRSVSLRYFNAAGADESGAIGEAHSPETHLIPLAILSGLGKRSELTIHGNDHPTDDGTPIRDYIHVTDLADAHVKALQWLLRGGENLSLNLGSGKGVSVQEVVAMIEKKIGRTIPKMMGPRNPSDPPVLVADITAAEKTIGWRPVHSDLETIIQSALKWHSS